MGRQTSTRPMMLAKSNVAAQDKGCHCYDCGGRTVSGRSADRARHAIRQRERRSWKREQGLRP